MASHDILINWTPQETRVAIVENAAVQELHIERALERGRVGNIYAGRVVRVLPGMQSAFVDVGLESGRPSCTWPTCRPTRCARHRRRPRRERQRRAAPPPPIEKLVFEGQTLVVQVIKDPIGTKGARLSTQISIAGRLLVFPPQDDHIGISQKIGSHELAREELRARAGAGRRRRRRLHPAHQRRRRDRCRTGRRHRVPAQDLAAASASAASSRPPARCCTRT